MKKLLCAILLVMSFGVFAQATSKSLVVRITEAQLKAAKSLHDIVAEIPSDCIVYQFNFVMIIHSSQQTAIVKYGGRADSNMPEDKLGLFTAWKKGDKFFIEKIDAGCSGPYNTASYKIMVE